MGTLTADNTKILTNNSGSFSRRDVVLAFGSSYNNTGNDATTGETLTAASVGLNRIFQVQISEDSGYGFEALGLDSADAQATCRIKVFQGGSVTSGATAPTMINNIATPVFSGTGQTSAGQVITTTDNQTMTLNQCAGMWFISATHGPYMIISNTAVTGAPAVLTVYGGAPTTDAGTYKIVQGLVASHTHTIGAAAGGEVPNATNLSSSLASVKATILGY